jgi:L-2-hydroxyglutarate oxidase
MRKGLGEMQRSINKRAFVKELRKLMPELCVEDLVKADVGVRAQAVYRDGRMVEDYYFEQSARILHVINAPSPAATSSLAIGEFIADKLIKNQAH